MTVGLSRHAYSTPAFTWTYLIHQARSNVLDVRIESPNMEHNTRATSSAPVFMSSSTGGTGSRFARAVTIVAGAAALVATILTFLYVSLVIYQCQTCCFVRLLTLHPQINMAPKVFLIATQPHHNQVLTRLAKTIASRFYSAMSFAS
jgi:hypothetical protein